MDEIAQRHQGAQVVLTRRVAATIPARVASSEVKKLYSRFLAASPGRLHFAAHSHHPWPDATREAQIEAWDDAARLADLKWDRIFGTVAKEAQTHIARTLDLPALEQIAFAPNTLEFVARLLSCFPPGKPVRILPTDSEFLSFSRQRSGARPPHSTSWRSPQTPRRCSAPTTKVDLVEVLWPDGTSTSRANVGVDQILVIEQGKGLIPAASLK